MCFYSSFCCIPILEAMKDERIVEGETMIAASGKRAGWTRLGIFNNVMFLGGTISSRLALLDLLNIRNSEIQTRWYQTFYMPSRQNEI